MAAQMKDDGGAAFACAAENGHQPGMSLRQWYAGLAMQGLISSNAFFPGGVSERRMERARAAFAQADAMLRESRNDS